MNEKPKILELNQAESEPLSTLSTHEVWSLIFSYYESEILALEENNKKKIKNFFFFLIEKIDGFLLASRKFRLVCA